MSRSGSHRGGGSQPAQRLDGVEPHVGIGIVERLEERRHRRGVLLIAEREGGLDAQVGVAVLQQRRQRAGDVEVGQRQQFERAAQDAEVAMLVAQRVDQRRQETRVGNARQPVHRRPGGRASRRRRAAGARPCPHRSSSSAGQRLGGALTDLGIGARQRLGDIALGLEPCRDVLDRDHGADDALVLAQRADRDALLHLREIARRRPRRAGDQVVMKGRGQHLDGAGGEHLLEVAQQAARRRDRAPPLRAAGRARRPRRRPVAAASQSSQTRTTSDTSVVKMPMSGRRCGHRGVSARRCRRCAVRRGAARPSPIDVKALAWSRSLVVVPRVSLTPAALRR